MLGCTLRQDTSTAASRTCSTPTSEGRRLEGGSASVQRQRLHSRTPAAELSGVYFESYAERLLDDLALSGTKVSLECVLATRLEEYSVFDPEEDGEAQA